MKLVGVCMASNEADVIEPFVRHNAAFLDALVVLDHASVDATPSILERLAAEGLPLALLRDRDPAFRQGERQTALAHRFIRSLQADFCFALDADEFVKAPSRAALEAALAALPPAHHGLVTLQNYVAGDAVDEPHPARRLTRRMRSEPRPMRKVILRREFADDPNNQVSLGNHAALRVAGGRAQPLAHAPVEGAWLAHFPVRSAQQVAKKALVGWLSHRLTRPEEYVAARPGVPPPASHWQRLFESLRDGAQIGPGIVEDALRAYLGTLPTADALVEDPLPAGELRYTEAAAPSAMATLAAWAERLVEDINASAARRSPRA